MSNPRGTDYAERLEMAIKLSYPVIYVVTFEASRASVALEEITKQTSKAFVEMPSQKTPSLPIHKVGIENHHALALAIAVFFVIVSRFFRHRY